MNLRPYQERAVNFLTSPPKHRGFIVAGCGSGKSFIIASSVARFAQSGMKIFVGVATVDQKTQMVDAFGFVQGPENVEIDIECMASQPTLGDYDLVVLDECAHLPAPQWLAAAKSAKCPIWGLSARPFGNDPERNAVIKDFYGDNFCTITSDELREAGVLVEGRYKLHDLDTAGEFDAELDIKFEKEFKRRCKVYSFMSPLDHQRNARWQITIEFLASQKRRNDKLAEIAADCISRKASHILLVGTVEHAQETAAVVGPDLVPVWAGMGIKNRRAVLGGFKKGTPLGIAGVKLIEEGFDAPIASELILGTAGRSPQALTQRVGRILRPFEGKECGIIHEFVDRGCRTAHAHHKARVTLYKQMGFSEIL